jgi:hypothetical protein
MPEQRATRSASGARPAGQRLTLILMVHDDPGISGLQALCTD